MTRFKSNTHIILAQRCYFFLQIIRKLQDNTQKKKLVDEICVAIISLLYKCIVMHA